MMNENRYKETFKAVSPSEEAVERIYEITTDKKKLNHSKVFKRVMATALTFMLVISGGFGIEYIAEKSRINHTNNTLGVYIAYGFEKELVKIDNEHSSQVFYRIIVNNYKKYNEEERKQIRDEKEKEIDRLLQNTRKFDQGVCGSSTGIQDKNGNLIGELYTVSCGEFVLDIDDYSAVKDITIEDIGGYGELEVLLSILKPDKYESYGGTLDENGKEASWFFRMEAYDNPNYLAEARTSNKITITGDELRTSYESGLTTIGLNENKINTGISISWQDSGLVNEKLNKNIDYNLSKIKGSIVFSIDYIDGTIKQSTVHYQFDKDGYMHLSYNK